MQHLLSCQHNLDNNLMCHPVEYVDSVTVILLNEILTETNISAFQEVV